jgi:hypothetical protein
MRNDFRVGRQIVIGAERLASFKADSFRADARISRLVNPVFSNYIQSGFGRAENRFRREPEEESPNTIGRDAA